MRFANKNGFQELNPFPGCNQIVVSNHAFIYRKNRGKGKGTKNHELNIKRAKFLGYDYVICTVRLDNPVQIDILLKHDFKELDYFFNKETENMVKIFGKKL